MKKYLITSPEFYTNIPEIFAKKLEEQLQKHQPDFVLLRDKQTSDYHSLAVVFMQVLQKYPNSKAFIHEDVSLAHALNAHGVHLTGNSFHKIKEAKQKNLEVVVSTHTKEEVMKVEKEGADYVSYSPIFDTPNKGKPKGIDDLKELLSLTNINVFALGGIVNDKEVILINETKVYGFASIRYFS